MQGHEQLRYSAWLDLLPRLAGGGEFAGMIFTEPVLPTLLAVEAVV
jgi:hypothetical protein